MRSLSLGLLVPVALLTWSCTRTNAQYCDMDTPCATGQCDYATSSCLEALDGDGGPVDAGADAMTCETSAMCTGNAPICDDSDQVCRGCTPSGGDAEECMLLDPATPQCADDGRCVECASSAACGDLTPICDAEVKECRACADSSECTESGFGECAPDGACVGCVDHGDCASDVCDARTRQCADASSVIYVGGNGASNFSACGTTTQPCATVQYALDNRVDATHDVVRLRAGNYDDAIISGLDVLIAGPGARLRGAASGKPVLEVSSGATVYLDGLEIWNGYGGSSAHGIHCKGTSTNLSLRLVDIGFNTGRGIESECDLSIQGGSVTGSGGTGLNITDGSILAEGMTVTSNTGGGVHIQGAAFRIVNSIIATNGVPTSSVGGVRIGNFDTLTPQVLAFNTIADNNASDTAPAYGVFCDVVNGSPATFRSNIVYGGSGPTDAVSGSCTFTYSNIIGGLPGEGNTSSNPRFIGNGNYHLMSDSPLKDKGAAVSGVERDIDGERRDAMPDIGADEL